MMDTNAYIDAFNQRDGPRKSRPVTGSHEIFITREILDELVNPRDADGSFRRYRKDNILDRCTMFKPGYPRVKHYTNMLNKAILEVVRGSRHSARLRRISDGWILLKRSYLTGEIRRNPGRFSRELRNLAEANGRRASSKDAWSQMLAKMDHDVKKPMLDRLCENSAKDVKLLAQAFALVEAKKMITYYVTNDGDCHFFREVIMKMSDNMLVITYPRDMSGRL